MRCLPMGDLCRSRPFGASLAWPKTPSALLWPRVARSGRRRGLLRAGLVVVQPLPRRVSNHRFDLTACQTDVSKGAIVEAAEQENARSPGPACPIGAPEGSEVGHDPEVC